MEFFSDEETVKLLQKLIAATRSYRLRWKSFEEYDYVTELNQFRFHLFTKDDDGVAPYALTVIKDRQALETLIQDEVSDNVGRDLVELYSLAKRHSLGGDQVVRDLFSSLDKLNDPPPF